MALACSCGTFHISCRNHVVLDPSLSLKTLDWDLCVLRSSVQGFVEEYKAKKYPIHGLINNAGIFLTEHAKTEDGFEVQGIGKGSVGGYADCTASQQQIRAYGALTALVFCADHNEDQSLRAIFACHTPCGRVEAVQPITHGLGGLTCRDLWHH